MLLTPFLSNSLLFLLLIGISIKDFKDGIIPDLYLIFLVVLGLLRFENAHLTSPLILGGLAYTLYKLSFLLKGQEALGLGDVKMLTASGLWLDPLQIPLYLIIGGGGGIVLGLF